MARNWLGNKKIIREDRYISKSKYTESAIKAVMVGGKIIHGKL